jgi:hypothetical protein
VLEKILSGKIPSILSAKMNYIFYLEDMENIMKKSKSKNSNHIDDFLEFQEHANNPYYYLTEGKQSPYSKARGKPLLAAIEAFAATAVGIFFMFIFYFGMGYGGTQWPGVFLFGTVSLLTFFVGMGYVRKHKVMQEERRLRREKLRVRHKKRE